MTTTTPHKAERIYTHPDGFSIHFDAMSMELIALDAEADSVIVPIGPQGLIELGLKLIEIGYAGKAKTPC